MKDIKRIFVLASLFLLFPSAGAFGVQEIAIKAGTILPISDAPIENGTILIKDGKIAALGQNIAVNSDVRVIDASGKFVMPGMIDAQSRLFVIDSELNESRSIAPELNILDGLDPYIKEAPEVAAQGVTAVYISPGSRSLIGGSGAVLKLNGSKDVGKMLLKGDIAVKAAIGVSAITNRRRSGVWRIIRLFAKHCLRRKYICIISRSTSENWLNITKRRQSTIRRRRQSQQRKLTSQSGRPDSAPIPLVKSLQRS